MSDIESPLTPSQLATVEELVEHRVAQRTAELEARVNELAERGKADRDAAPDGIAMIVFSGDLDKLIAAFSLSTAAASMGLQVSMFFAFWGLAAVRRRTVFKGKSWVGKILSAMLPSGPHYVPTSQMNYFGIGSWLFKYLMRKHQSPSLGDLIAAAER
jgi:peroxiredoxin family protein